LNNDIAIKTTITLDENDLQILAAIKQEEDNEKLFSNININSNHIYHNNLHMVPVLSFKKLSLK